MRDPTHLIKMLGNKMYSSVPLKFLGDDGVMNIYVETAIVADGERTIYDRAPDVGFISIGGVSTILPVPRLWMRMEKHTQIGFPRLV